MPEGVGHHCAGRHIGCHIVIGADFKHGVQIGHGNRDAGVSGLFVQGKGDHAEVIAQDAVGSCYRAQLLGPADAGVIFSAGEEEIPEFPVDLIPLQRGIGNRSGPCH